MKSLACSALILLLSVQGFGWSNGGRSQSLRSPKFGMHDWIAFEAYRMAGRSADLDWIADEMNAFFIGTEAPDVGAPGELNAGGGYSDTRSCHCVRYDESDQAVRTRAALRAQEEFDKAAEALANGDRRLAAFYAGAMSHYIADLGQFMHMMGPDSRWGQDDDNLHKRYEEIFDKNLDVAGRRSRLLSRYIRRVNVAGATANEVTVRVARLTDTGGGTVATPGWMYEQWEAYVSERTEKKPEEWDRRFLDQTGRNVNTAVNAIAQLLVKLSSR